MKKLIRFLRDEEGVTAIEYGLIAAGIGIAIVTVVGTVGDELVNLFNDVVTALQENPQQ
jgi:pilus assembly protein Flp/PilA